MTRIHDGPLIACLYFTFHAADCALPSLPNMSSNLPPLLSSSPSLMRLALVERQLVLQHLDYTSLARVLCTCRQLAVEALHPQCGKFIQTQSTFPLKIAEAVGFTPWSPNPIHASPLFRAHMPIELRLTSEHAEDIPGLIAQLVPFKRFHEIVLWEAGAEWTEEQALQFLQSPVAQSLRRVWGLRPHSIWMDSLAVQRAIFALPLLHKISCDFDPQFELSVDQGALTEARMLREVTIELPTRDHRGLAPFAAVPHLTHLELLLVRSTAAETPPCTTSIPTLTFLSLDVRESAASGAPTRAQLRALLAGFPKLEVLLAETFNHSESVLRSCLALGAARLPALRCVEILSRGGVSVALLRRFLVQFPAVEQVKFRFNDDANGARAWSMLSTWSQCPRVLIVPPSNDPPEKQRGDDEPHASDTEEAARGGRGCRARVDDHWRSPLRVRSSLILVACLFACCFVCSGFADRFS